MSCRLAKKLIQSQLGAGGSVVANAGFIKQFGTKKGEGVRALDPTWLSTWSALLVCYPLPPDRRSMLIKSERWPDPDFYSHLLVGIVLLRFVMQG